MMDDLKGKVQTVLGPVEPSTLGKTLTHEHMSLLYTVAYVPPSKKEEAKSEAAFSLETLGWIRQYPYSHKSNILFNDEATYTAVLEDLKQFHSNGGGTIVENTTYGLERNVKFLKDAAVKSNVNIIAGTGYYVAASQPTAILNKKEEELAETMRHELTVGCEDTNIKCGIIGEIGCSWPMPPFDKKILRASAVVQKELGCPVMIHPGRHQEAPFEIIRIFQEAGGNVEKTVMAHIERTIFDETELAEFASLGSYCELDLFGTEVSYYQLNDKIDMPNDAQRIQIIRHLINEGFEDKIVVSHDIHTKHRLTKFGGHGYSHLLCNVVPRMLDRGISQNLIDKMLIHNPRKWLTF